MSNKSIRSLVISGLQQNVRPEEMQEYLHKKFCIDVSDVRLAKTYTEIKYNSTVAKDIDKSQLEVENYCNAFTYALELLKQKKLFIEVAVQLNLKEEDVKGMVALLNIKALPFYQPTLYEFFQQQEKTLNTDFKEVFNRYRQLEEKFQCDITHFSSSSMVKKYYRVKRENQIVQEYIKSGFNVSDQHLAKMFKFASKESIALILNHKEKLLEYTNEEIANQILEYRMQMRQQKRIENNFTQKEFQSSYIFAEHTETDTILLKIHSQIDFWFQIMVNYRLNVNDFAQLINYDDVEKLDKYLVKIIELQSPWYLHTYHYIQYMYSKRDEQALENARHYIKQLQALKATNQLVEARRLLRQLKQVEYDFKKVVMSRKGDKLLTDEEKLTALKFKLKYALPWSALQFTKNNILAMHQPLPEEVVAELEKNEIYAQTGPSRK